MVICYFLSRCKVKFSLLYINILKYKNLGFLSLIKLFVLITYLAHISACAWHFLAIYQINYYDS